MNQREGVVLGSGKLREAQGDLDGDRILVLLRARERMQRLTLEVIQRVVFGSRDDELRDALRKALDMTSSTPKLIALTLTPAPAAGPWPRASA